MSLTVREVLEAGVSSLRTISPSAHLDAALLFCHVSKLTRIQCISRSEEEVSHEVIHSFQELLTRRARGEPVAYILGAKEFFGAVFEVNPAVLIPRPDTEVLVERAFSIIDSLNGRAEVLDLGTGSGCIPIVLAIRAKKRGESFRAVAVDVSEDALTTAKRNALRHGVGELITFMKSDWFSGIPPKKRFDLIVSNPPYIAISDTSVSPETSFEPKGALYSGSQGLDALTEILGSAHQHLTSHGSLLCEIGYDQQHLLRQLLQGRVGEYYRTPTFYKDLAGHDRVLELAAK